MILPTGLIKPNYLVILFIDTAPLFLSFRNLTLLYKVVVAACTIAILPALFSQFNAPQEDKGKFEEWLETDHFKFY